MLRTVLWVGLPVALAVLAVGPARLGRALRRGWRWLWERRLNPEDILGQVVRQHAERIRSLRQALRQAETTEQEIAQNIEKSTANIATLDEEARRCAERSDDLGARAALYKLNLERAAVDSFNEHLVGQRHQILEARRRLYLFELQLRQCEVGRSILLSQLAEAKTVEQQYAIANEFDPFSAVANWRRAEGIVQEKTIQAHAIERVHRDTADLGSQASPADPALLDAQLAEIKARLKPKVPAEARVHAAAETTEPRAREVIRDH